MFSRILTCAFCFQNWMTAKSVFTIIRVLWILSIGAIVPVSCQPQCPSVDTLHDVSFDCFTNYNTQKIFLENSGRRLFSGIDIEILRAYCSAYIDGITCINSLIKVCPETMHEDIVIGITHLRGTEKTLAELCKTQGLYELYSQNRRCFLDRGHKSEWCITHHINSSSSAQFLSHDEFCSRVREATRCVENNIRHGCGEKAAELVHQLVKPTIRDSGKCTYDVYSSDTSEQPKDIKGGTNRPHRPPSDQGKREAGHTNSNNASVSLSSNVTLIALAINISILSYISSTFKFTRIS